MIYTVTLNPSIDYVIYPNSPIKLGQLNRIEKDQKTPGGKGINVSRILTQLNTTNVALGFVGGHIGQLLIEQLHDESVKTDFTHIDADTRINVKIKGGQETEINDDGPLVTEADSQHFYTKLDKLSEDDLVVIAGSKPKGLSEDYYQRLIDHVKSKKADFIIDTTGEELQMALAQNPLLVKPNIHELEDLYGVTLDGLRDIVPYGKKMLEAGAQYAIISLGGDGALFFMGDDVYYSAPPKGQLVNSVGSGDSMIGGFIGEYQKNGDPLAAFKMSLACGSATAFKEDLAKKEDIDKLLPQITIEKWEEK
ncbi:fructose-1-phosphate kinase [Alkalibacterium putridalgicola]|uniref:Tagatose-6-phosphate kinase n=1 Tax=Alkalibacterium putridalgicola TaxID=426703 RepID=A0A1H7SN80_9LACT|nr:1-phosphofructokinase [Alkalibacterium putridalgicola]GEK89203.1 tagatose-6-phosphate kinase [Alkalibacterium putridalgicola]SEL74072.1 fructose-1-phosphate kinase [Alkalibacterium putridalgicola]